MNQVKEILTKILNKTLQAIVDRKNIGIRFVLCMLYAGVCCALIFATGILVFLQFACLLVTTKHNEAIKTLSHKLLVYIYRMLRFITLNENLRPYPFGPFPEEMEPAEETDLSANPTPSETTAPVEEPAAQNSEDDVQEAVILDKKDSE